MANEDKREEILRAREGFLANQPQLTLNPPIEVEKEVLEQNPDPDSIIFESKIVPKIETDVLISESAPGHFYSEATLAAINLPGWADTLWRYATADLKAFFIELGKALSTKRRLWDKKDEHDPVELLFDHDAKKTVVANDGKRREQCGRPYRGRVRSTPAAPRYS